VKSEAAIRVHRLGSGVAMAHAHLFHQRGAPRRNYRDGTPDPDRRTSMTDSNARNPEKDPSDWTTGDEPMTGPQHSYLSTLAQEAGVEVPDSLSKAEASAKIDELQQQTGRGNT
jgi:hypothetical protein